MLYNPRLTRSYAVRDDIPVMLVDEATTVDADEHDRIMALHRGGGHRSDLHGILTTARAQVVAGCRPMKTVKTGWAVSLRDETFSTSDHFLYYERVTIGHDDLDNDDSTGRRSSPGCDRSRGRPGTSDRVRCGLPGRWRRVLSGRPCPHLRQHDVPGPVDADGSVDVPVVGLEGVPAENVLAVAVNVTIAERTRARVSPR